MIFSKAQVSLDLLIGFSIMLFILIFSFLLLKPYTYSAKDEARRLCGELASTINLVAAGGDKFHMEFTLPSDLNGEDYNVTFVNSSNVIIIEFESGEIACETNTRKVIGEKVRPPATLSITNLDDYVYITSCSAEKTYYKESELKNKNLTIRGFGFKPNTTLNLSIYDSSNKLVLNSVVNTGDSYGFLASFNLSNFSKGAYTIRALYSINKNNSLSGPCNPPIGTNLDCGCKETGYVDSTLLCFSCIESSDCAVLSGDCSVADPPCPEVKNAFVVSNSCSTNLIVVSSLCICKKYPDCGLDEYCQGGDCTAGCSNDGTCNYECYPGYYDCNGDISDGCESNWPCSGVDIPSADILLLSSSFRFFIE